MNPKTIKKEDNFFYICSYTGCGEYILKRALQKKGYCARICYSPNPPDKLEFVHNDGPNNIKTICEYNTLFNFNKRIVPIKFINNINIIFLYRNPIHSIYTTLKNKIVTGRINYDSLDFIKFEDVINQKKDLYGLERVFDNYTIKNYTRNYRIIAINFDKLIECQDTLSRFLGIEPLGIVKNDIEPLLEMVSNLPNKKEYLELLDIYYPLIKKLNDMPPIKII